MPKFSITYDVNGGSGSVTYTVEAKTREEGVEMLRSGKGDITLYEVEPSYQEVDYTNEVFEGE